MTEVVHVQSKFGDGQQHDSHEFLRCLSYALAVSILPASLPLTTVNSQISKAKLILSVCTLLLFYPPVAFMYINVHSAEFQANAKLAILAAEHHMGLSMHSFYQHKSPIYIKRCMSVLHAYALTVFLRLLLCHHTAYRQCGLSCQARMQR